VGLGVGVMDLGIDALSDDAVRLVVRQLARTGNADFFHFAVTCHRIFSMAVTELRVVELGPPFVFESVSNEDLAVAEQLSRIAAHMLRLAGPRRRVVLRGDALPEPPAWEQGWHVQRRPATNSFLQRVLAAVAIAPVESLVLDATTVRLMSAGVPVASPGSVVELTIDLLVMPELVIPGLISLLAQVGPSLDRLVLADLPQAFRPGHSPFAALPELVAGLPGHPPVLLPQLSTLHLIGEVAEEAMARLVEAAPFVQTLHITGEISLHALRPAALPAWPSLADVGVVLTRLPPQQIGARPFLSGRRLTRLIICESDLGATINREQFGSSLPSEVSGALAAMVERPDTCSIGLPCADVPHAGFLPAA